MAGLIDQYGQPLRKQVLTTEVAGPTLAGVRSPIAGYPSNGLNPTRLASLLMEADQGEPLRFFELAELIEERDLHYAGVLGTRKRAVSQIDVTVEAASDSAEDVAKADMVREWLKRDELAEETFHMLDAIGKGISFTEIMWETSAGQWWPRELVWQDPRWFTFDRKDLRAPLLRGGPDGNEQATPLPAFKFIVTQISAKSGIPVRGGVARLAAWSYMFKAFTLRDWAIFCQTFGQPVRLGKFPSGATKEDKATLYRAVANIAGDCAAIIPQSMEIEFVEASNVTGGSELYMNRADWFDRQVSKGVLGQTNSTDAQSGGLGSGQAQLHGEVREDIETADCKALAAVWNRDLIRPWCDLEYGPPANGRGAYPRVRIARPAQEDLKLLSDSLAQLVPLGFEVEQSEVRDKFGFSEPKKDAKILMPSKPADRPANDVDQIKALMSAGSTFDEAITALSKISFIERVGGALGDDRLVDLMQAKAPKPHPAEQITDDMAREGETPIGDMVETIALMMEKTSDLGELREMIFRAYGQLDSAKLAAVIAGALSAAEAAGRSDLLDESAA